MRSQIIDKPYDPDFNPGVEDVHKLYLPGKDQRTYRLTDLIPSTKYRIGVSAHNRAGEGPAYEVDISTMPATVAGNFGY